MFTKDKNGLFFGMTPVDFERAIVEFLFETTTIEKLDACVNYQYRDTLSVMGALQREKQNNFLRKDLLRDLIEAKHKIVETTLQNKVSRAATAYQNLMIAQGKNPLVAYFIAIQGMSEADAIEKAKSLPIVIEKKAEEQPVLGKTS
jgi:hypothetical protein